MTEPVAGPDVRDRLIDAAKELLSERPNGSVSLRDIAERAGLHHSLIHRHFGSREQLLRAVAGRLAVQYWEAVYAIDVTPEDPAAGFREGFAYMLQSDRYVNALAGVLLAQGANAQDSFPGVDLHVAQLERVVAGRTTRRDPRLTTVAVVAMMGGWSMLEEWAIKAAGLQDMDIADVRREVAEMIDDFIRLETSPAD